MEEKITARIKVFIECEKYLIKASDYFKINVVNYQDSLSLGLLCDAGIERADVFVNVGCILLSSRMPIEDFLEEGRKTYREILEDKTTEAIEVAIKSLTDIKVKFAKYKEMNIDGFNRIDQKILELKSLNDNCDNLTELSRKALDP